MLAIGSSNHIQDTRILKFPGTIHPTGTGEMVDVEELSIPIDEATAMKMLELYPDGVIPPDKIKIVKVGRN